MTQSLLKEIEIAAREAPQMYFAPLVGAIKGIRLQYRQLNRRSRRTEPAPATRESATESGTVRR